jgi:hypothetical protein
MRNNQRTLLLLSGGIKSHPLVSFTPDLLLDYLWPSSLYQDSSGTVPTGATDVVGYWRDLSGNNRNFTNGTTAEKPLNSANGLVFDGSNDVLSWTASSAFTLTAQTTIVVGTQANAGAAFGRWFTQNATGGLDSAASGHYVPILRAVGAIAASYADGSSRGNFAITYDQFYVMTSHHSGAAITNYLNNTASTPYSHALNYAVQVQSIGNRLPEKDSASAITVKFVASWRRALAAGEMTTIRSYLYSRFGVTP